MQNIEQLKELLEQKYRQFNTWDFIKDDPIQIPHKFKKKEDIEIAAFLSAMIAWGNRKMIIRNALKMMKIMNFEPYNFLMNTSFAQLEHIPEVKHRTFNRDDFIFFLKALKNIYENYDGLEAVFYHGYKKNKSIKEAIIHFRKVFFSLNEWLPRTQKHIPDPQKGSAAKRLNMFLMWMVRKDYSNVHFGIWKYFDKKNLMLPLDIHTGNAARYLGLLKRKQNDWKAVVEITETLKKFDPNDPVKYDFALFGIDIELKKSS